MSTTPDTNHRCRPGNISLPVVNGASSSAPTIAPSRASNWRAAVLIGVYVLMAAHLVQWLITGRTLSPVEPSESMETIRNGYLNAGFIFFAVAILSTLIFGRYFCGWGCHIVALQDLCTWLLRKARIRPKPFRSRLLIFVPLGAALYMFVWPQFYMWFIEEASRPETTNHLMTSQFWKTFPGIGIAILTFVVCGFLIVYLLGNKGFCTYACPYGGFFAPADTLAPGRIRVTDACEHCGHCTSVCTSNVRVHQEVRDYGMVVDPGCMKCMDCVTVCPNDALYFGFGRPSAFAGRRTEKPKTPKRYDFTWGEEIFMAAAFMTALLVFRGLYELIPFLLSLGIAALFAYLMLFGLRLVTQANVRLHAWQLKRGGRIGRAGAVYAAVLAGVLAITAHSAVFQYHNWRGSTAYARFENAQRKAEEAAIHGRPAPDEPIDEFAAASLEHLQFCDRWGLADSPQVNLSLAALSTRRGDFEDAERRLKRVIALLPNDAQPRFVYGNFLGHQQRLDEAIGAYEQTVQRDERHQLAHFNLGYLLVAKGQLKEGEAAYRAAIDAGLNDPAVYTNLCDVLLAQGRVEDAIAQLDALLEIAPEFPGAELRLGSLYMSIGKRADGVAHLEKAAEQNPDDQQAQYLLAEARRESLAAEGKLPQPPRTPLRKPRSKNAFLNLGQLLLKKGKPEEAVRHLRSAAEAEPDNAEIEHTLATALEAAGHPEEARTHFDRACELDPQYCNAAP